MFKGIVKIYKNGELYLAEYNTFTRCGKNIRMGMRELWSHRAGLLLITSDFDDESVYYSCIVPDGTLLLTEYDPFSEDPVPPITLEIDWPNDVTERLCLATFRRTGPITLYGIAMTWGSKPPNQYSVAFKRFEPPVVMEDTDVYVVSYCVQKEW